MAIAIRTLSISTKDGQEECEIRIFQPQIEDDAWSCSYEIDWPTGTKRGRAAGIDGIQAMFLALQKVGIMLYTSEYHKNGQLSWVSAPQGGYGFPVPSNVRNLLIGEDLVI